MLRILPKRYGVRACAPLPHQHGQGLEDLDLAGPSPSRDRARVSRTRSASPRSTNPRDEDLIEGLRNFWTSLYPGETDPRKCLLRSSPPPSSQSVLGGLGVADMWPSEGEDSSEGEDPELASTPANSLETQEGSQARRTGIADSLAGSMENDYHRRAVGVPFPILPKGRLGGDAERRCFCLSTSRLWPCTRWDEKHPGVFLLVLSGLCFFCVCGALPSFTIVES